jgi:hypothetical protein
VNDELKVSPDKVSQMLSQKQNIQTKKVGCEALSSISSAKKKELKAPALY